MKHKFLYISVFILSAFCIVQAQNRLAIVNGQEVKYIPVYNRQSSVYFSVRHFAEALSINYFINRTTQKIELKFSNNNKLKITAKNPFVVFNSFSPDLKQVFQLPTSTYLVNGDIYVPLKYSLHIIEQAFGKALEINSKNQIEVGSVQVNRIHTAEAKEPPAEDENKSVSSESSYSSADFNITGLDIEEKANGTLVHVYSNKRVPSYYSAFKDGVLKIIFRKVKTDINAVENADTEGLVKKVKAKNINDDTEFLFELNADYTTSEVINVDNSNDLLITIHNKIFANTDNKEKLKEKWNFDVVVIDAGHGGKDAGAIGVNGVKEKDVNLGIALKLGKLIQRKLKDVKVVYTRSDDRFIELYKRGKIANDKGGKLFISIHCNSTPRKPTDANGFEVYLLRPGRTEEAIAIAERENSVIQYEENPDRYQKLTDENFILVSMAHSAYMKYSEQFADLINQKYAQKTRIGSRGIKQAGFYVLVGAAMPSVLVETGFLSNRKDAAYLKSKSGQQKIAEAIFEAVKNFKTKYEKSINSE